MSKTSPIPSKLPKSGNVCLQKKNHDRDHLLLVGGGPRSIIQINAEVIFILLYRKHFEELIGMGASYDIVTTVLEKQSVLGVGGAYSNGQTGMMNSGVEDDIRFPIHVPSQCASKDFLQQFLSYKSRYDILLQGKLDLYYEEIKGLNLPGAVMFKRSVGPISSSPNDRLEHERAYLLRKTVGEEESETFEAIRKLAGTLFPFYRLNVLPSTTVRRIDIESRENICTEVWNSFQCESAYIRADQVRLNIGTITTNPIFEDSVRDLTFCIPMNVNHFKLFCHNRNVLDHRGFLVPGTKFLSGGTGLSGLDQISVLDGVMKLFEEDSSQPLGYKVTNNARRKHQGAITLICRTPGKVCYPRHTSCPDWKQGTPVMATTKHLHALFLHNCGEKIFTIWFDIMTATVARAMSCCPRQAKCRKSSSEALVRSQFQETSWHLKSRMKAGREELLGNYEGKEYFLNESTRTQYGAWRQAALSLILGFACEEDIGRATKNMEDYAPITWKGRQGWLFHRAQLASITDISFATKRSNMEYVKPWEEIMRHVTASPVEIHSMFYMLVDAGIATFVHAPYSDIEYDSSAGKLSLKGVRYDAMIVSPVFERNEDGVTHSLANQIRLWHRETPNFGKVGKFRRYENKKGRPIMIEENGLGGRGFLSRADDGEVSRIGSFAVDVNNRASGVSVASSFTVRRMALSHLKAAGVTRAERRLDLIYESGKPTNAAYETEVKKFHVHFQEVYKIWAYLEAIKLAAKEDDELYTFLFDAGLEESMRKNTIRILSKSGNPIFKQAAMLYQECLKEMPSFAPPSRDDYLARFVDTTDEEDKHMYTEAYRIAKEHLMRAQKQNTVL